MMAKQEGTNTRAEQIEVQNIIQRRMSMPISPENRALMLGARASGMLGNTAFQKVLKLDVGNLRILSTWTRILADIKEQLQEEQSALTSGEKGENDGNN